MPWLFTILIAVGVLIATMIWLVNAAREPSDKRSELTLADKQLALYSVLHARARDDPEAQRTLEQVELSRTIYQNTATAYNHCIARRVNRPLARILGYQPIMEVKIE